MTLVPVEQVMGLPMIVGAHTSDEVQAALNWASSSIESYCEREFGWRSSDEVTLNPYFAHIKAMPAISPMSAYASYPGYGVSFSSFGSTYVGQTMLPNPPVSNVSQVMAWLPMVAGAAPGWVELVNYQWAEDGLVWDTTGTPGIEADGGPVPSWPRAPRSLQITYDHGYALPEGNAPSDAPPLPQGVIDAVIRGAALYLDNPTGSMENRVGEITNRYDPTGPAGWLDEKLLGKYRLVSV